METEKESQTFPIDIQTVVFVFKRAVESLFPFLKADILVHYSTLLSSTKQYFNSQTALQRFIWIDLALVE